MERGGNGGGFHGYRRPPQPQLNSGMKLPEINIGLPEQKINNSTADENECTVREQDRFMPIANVIRLMRKIIPSHAKISDDAKETIQECVSEFISFVTGEANARCQQEQRKTITAEDVLWAMSNLGFDDYIEPLTIYLNRFRDVDGGDRGSLRGEPLVKRSVDPGSLRLAAFAPVFRNGFFGAAAMGGFLKDAHNAGPSGGAVAGLEPYAKCKE